MSNMAQVLGWDDTAEKEFLKALRQPLINQTPLQVLVESLFGRIQNQSKVLNDVAEKVDNVLRNDFQVTELLGRIRLLEETLQHLTDTKLSPFQQQEIFKRLEDVEKLTSKLDAKIIVLKEENVPDIFSRLNKVEHKLSGVYNLNGRLIAIDEMAVALGIIIPNLEFNGSVMTPQEISRTSVSQQSGISLQRTYSTLSISQPRTPATSQAKNDVDGAVVESIQSQIAACKEENLRLSERVRELQNQVGTLDTSLQASEERQARHVIELQESASRSQDALLNQIQSLRKDAQRSPELSFADYSKLESALKTVTEKIGEYKTLIMDINERDIPRINKKLQELQGSIKTMDAPREMDTFFHTKITMLEKDLEVLHDVSTGLRSQIKDALDSSLNSLVHEADLEPLVNAVTSKAGTNELRHVSRQLAELTKHVNDITELVYSNPGNAALQQPQRSSKYPPGSSGMSSIKEAFEGRPKSVGDIGNGGSGGLVSTSSTFLPPVGSAGSSRLGSVSEGVEGPRPNWASRVGGGGMMSPLGSPGAGPDELSTPFGEEMSIQDPREQRSSPSTASKSVRTSPPQNRKTQSPGQRPAVFVV